MHRFARTLVALIVCLSATSMGAYAKASDEPRVNNPYGVHLLIHDLSRENVERQLTWVKHLIGRHGYVKQLFCNLNENTTGAHESYKQFVQLCYDYEFIPIIRLAGEIKDGIWQKPYADGPNDYSTVASAMAKFVADLPRSDEYPLYIEIWNEPNNHYEWSGRSCPIEYGHFYVQTVKAIRAIGDPRIKVTIGAMSPGGSYDNLKFIDVMCREVPGFLDSFDVWASHPYPTGPPEINRFNSNLPKRQWQFGIDGYRAELDVLAKYGVTDVNVILAETGYFRGSIEEDLHADYSMRAFRDYWSQWPEVLAVTPFTFSDPVGGFSGGDWVHPDSGTDKHGLPTKAHANYWAVHKLAKPTDPHGAISGKVVESRFENPISGVKVVLSTGAVTETDGAGNYFFPRLEPGTYLVEVSGDGYSSDAKTELRVSAGNNTVVNFALDAVKQGVIGGTIKHSVTGKGLSRAMVMLTPGDFKALTDSDGCFVLSDIPPSVYTLDVTKFGYYNVSKDKVVVSPGGSTQVNLYTGEGRPPTGKSLIGEADFEFGDDGPAGGWTIWVDDDPKSLIWVDRSVRYTGNASQRIEPNGSERHHVWQMTNYSSIRPGRTYRIEAWARTENAVGEVKLQGGWFTNETVGTGIFTSEKVLSGTTGWTKLIATGVAPEFPDGRRGRLQVRMVAGLESGVAWFDQAWAGTNPPAE